MVNVSQQTIIDVWFYCDDYDAPYGLYAQCTQFVLALPLLEIRTHSVREKVNF